MYDPEEAAKLQRSFRIIAAVTVLALGGGVLFYHFTEGMSWVDAFYFCTVTLATVGYGDITPKTDAGKIFTSFYILGGVGIIATFATLLLKNTALRRERRRQAKTQKPKGKLL